MDLLYFSDLRRYEKKLKSYLSLNSTIDFSYKAKLLKDNVPLYLTQACFNEKQEILRDLPVNTSFRDYLSDEFGFCAMLEAYRLNDSYKHRILRLRKKILNVIMQSHNIFFLTFTFKNSVLKSTDSYTRRRYVQRWLKSNCYDYVGNIDFGEKNHREHYHALVSIDRVDTHSWLINGAMNFEQVYLDKNIDEKMAKYINKFMYHAIKETTKRQHLIYKRNI